MYSSHLETTPVMILNHWPMKALNMLKQQTLGYTQTQSIITTEHQHQNAECYYIILMVDDYWGVLSPMSVDWLIFKANPKRPLVRYQEKGWHCSCPKSSFCFSQQLIDRFSILGKILAYIKEKEGAVVANFEQKIKSIANLFNFFCTLWPCF